MSEIDQMGERGQHFSKMSEIQKSPKGQRLLKWAGSSSTSHFGQNHHVVLVCLVVIAGLINRKLNSDISSLLKK